MLLLMQINRIKEYFILRKPKSPLRNIVRLSLFFALFGGVFGCAQDNPMGLSELHEDSESFAFTVSIKNTSDTALFPSALAPLAWAVFKAGDSLFVPGVSATPELQALAEDGDPEGLIDGLSKALAKGHLTEPLAPGATASFVFNASPGSVLSFASMVVETNDVFVGLEKNHVDLFDGRNEPLSGPLVMALFDAGTEVNQVPGSGGAQAPRQSAPNTGAEESHPVALLSERQDGFDYPAAAQLLQVSLEVAHEEDDHDHDHG